MAEGGERKKKAAAPEGSPLWVITFADLMSQLMCFFVLILSFSNSDEKTYVKYFTKMANNFTVQIENGSTSFPSSSTMIGIENIVGMPMPTILELDQNLNKKSDSDSNTDSMVQRQFLSGNSGSVVNVDLQNTTREIQGILMDEIKDGFIDVLQDQNNVIIRLHDSAVFVLQTAVIKATFLPVIEKTRMVIAQIKGDVEVVGYQDDKQVQNTNYRSNWEFSAMRASAIVEALLKTQELDKNRFLLTAYGDTRPLVPNNSDDNREKNRRIEIILHQAKNYPVSYERDTLPIGAKALLPTNTPLNQQPSIEKNGFQRGAP